MHVVGDSLYPPANFDLEVGILLLQGDYVPL